MSGEQTRAKKALALDASSINLQTDHPIKSHKELMETDWASMPWKYALAKSFRNHLQLKQVLENIEDVDPRVYKAFDMRVTPFVAQQMDSFDSNCPIRLQYIPDSRELEVKPWEISDSLGEDHDMIPGTFLTHRYPQRVLFLAAQTCASLCRYCTRRRFVSNPENPVRQVEIDNSITYLAEHTEVQDCLISGGDPLLLSDEKLDYICREIRSRAPHVKFLRIGTRMPVQLPTRVTDDLCTLIEKNNVQMLNVHINHPKEITPLFCERIRKLRYTGVMLGNQSVMLRGVNDSVSVMRELCMTLIEIGIRPYYVYSPDQTEGSDHHKVSLEKMLAIQDGLRGWISGPAIPTFVSDGVGGLGKVPMSSPTIQRHPSLNGEVWARNYEGKQARQRNLE